MIQRLRNICFLALAAALCVTPCAWALPADSPADTVAPYIDNQTFIIGRLDVSQIPLKDVLGRATTFLKEIVKEPDAQGQIEAVFGQVSMMRNAFLGVGGKEVYLIVSMADLPYNPAFFVVTCSDPQKLGDLELFVSQLTEGARPGAKLEVQQSGDGVLLVATEYALGRLKALEAKPRAEVLAAWKAAKQSPIQVLITPSEDQHRVMLETFPNFPEPWDGITGNVVSDGVQWGVLTLEAAPRLKAQLLVKSKNPEAAQRLKDVVRASLDALGNMPQVREMIPQAGQVLSLIQPEVSEARVTVTLTEDQETLNAVTRPLVAAVTAARKSARQMQSMNNMKQIGLAMHNYHDVHKRFPPAASVDESGKPLLSWRVHILPFVEQQALYQEFKLDEPWDSEHNKKLINTIPRAYMDPNIKLKPGTTSYLAVVGEGTILRSAESLRLRDIRDGSSNTLMVVNAHPDSAVIWTKPDDLPVTKENPLKGLTGKGRTGFESLLADGSVRRLTEAVDKATLWLMFDANDRQPIDWGKIR